MMAALLTHLNAISTTSGTALLEEKENEARASKGVLMHSTGFEPVLTTVKQNTQGRP